MQTQLGTCLSVDITLDGTPYTRLPSKLVGYVVELATPFNYPITMCGFTDIVLVEHVVTGKRIEECNIPYATASDTPVSDASDTTSDKVHMQIGTPVVVDITIHPRLRCANSYGKIVGYVVELATPIVLSTTTTTTSKFTTTCTVRHVRLGKPFGGCTLRLATVCDNVSAAESAAAFATEFAVASVTKFPSVFPTLVVHQHDIEDGDEGGDEDE